MKTYTIETLGGWLQIKPVISQPENRQITELLYDSRQVNQAETSLFIALNTGRNDGHRFIPELIRKGVFNFLVETLPESEFSGQANFLVVPDSLKALQDIASFHRRLFDFPVIGITGSNGKTIVKEWLYQLLSADFRIVRSPKSFNSQIGVPVSVWQLNDPFNLAIIEAGISHPGEMEALENVIKPTLGIFTNIGTAHAENFESQTQHILEKACLFRNSESVFYCRDHQSIHTILNAETTGRKYSWGFHADSDLRILSLEKEQHVSKIVAEYNGYTFRFNIPFQDEASNENALHCVLVMLVLGCSFEQIHERVEKLHSLEMRLELNRAIHGCTLINDAYSADTESLRIALDVMLSQNQHKRRTVILSDIPESGKNQELLYREIAALLKRKQVNRIIGVGEEIASHATYFECEKMFFLSTEALLNQLQGIPFKDECILLKGARLFGFERVADVLLQKTHETVLEINLNAVIDNLNFYRKQIAPSVKVMAMVKAFSYGSGSFEIANILQNNGVDSLAVAYADEGIELRQAGISLPIMVMNPEVDSFHGMIENRLEPEIYSFRVLDEYSKAVSKRNGFDGQPLKIHIKLDTGMHRLGFEEIDLNELVKRILALAQLRVASVFSHLAGSSEPEMDEFTELQAGRFKAWTEFMERGLNVPFLRHILNSSGIIRQPDLQFEMVRLGIGLYGIGAAEEQAGLKAVSSLKTTISQLRKVDPGETIGYSRKGKVDKPSIIATLPIGYADGFSRTLGNGKGNVRINGINAATIGSICMDMCMVDVTHIPDLSEGDPVVIFENADDIHRLAATLGTIPYEVLTNISARVKRVYFQE
jgi:alanine racemase